MSPITAEDHEQKSRWVTDATSPHLSLWTASVRGCVMHVPGHWIALRPPPEPHSEEYAALLCDSLRPSPFALSAEEVGELFALVACRHQETTEETAGEWSLYVVER